MANCKWSKNKYYAQVRKLGGGEREIEKCMLGQSGREIRKNNLVDVIKVCFICKYKIIIVNTFLSFKKS